MLDKQKGCDLLAEILGHNKKTVCASAPAAAVKADCAEKISPDYPESVLIFLLISILWHG